MSVGVAADGGDDSDDRWERVARQMLAERLETVAMGDVRDAFIGAASRLDAGEELTEQDINDLRSALEDAAHVVDLAAEASPEAAPLARHVAVPRRGQPQRVAARGRGSPPRERRDRRRVAFGHPLLRRFRASGRV